MGPCLSASAWNYSRQSADVSRMLAAHERDLGPAREGTEPSPAGTAGAYSHSATHSISTSAPAGSLATWKVLRAGGFSLK